MVQFLNAGDNLNITCQTCTTHNWINDPELVPQCPPALSKLFIPARAGNLEYICTRPQGRAASPISVSRLPSSVKCPQESTTSPRHLCDRRIPTQATGRRLNGANTGAPSRILWASFCAKHLAINKQHFCKDLFHGRVSCASSSHEQTDRPVDGIPV